MTIDVPKLQSSESKLLHAESRPKDTQTEHEKERDSHTIEGTLNAEQSPTAQTRSRNAFSFFQSAAGADFLAFLGINDA